MPKLTRIALDVPDNEKEAVMCILSGVWFFLCNHTIKTGMVLILVFGAPGYVLIDWYRTDRVDVEKAVPLSENVQFEIMPKAIAGEKGAPIYIGKQLYGYADTSFALYKLMGKDVILVHDKMSGSVVKIDGSFLNRNRLKQYK
jgi:hypothetical protein